MEEAAGSCNICRKQLAFLQAVAEEEECAALALFSLERFVLSAKWLFSARVGWTRPVTLCGTWRSASSCPG